MGKIFEIALTAAIAILLLLVGHYWPWKALLRRSPNILMRYVSGVLALDIPLTVLFALWGETDVIYALWGVTVTGGAAVIVTHLLDSWIEARERADLAERNMHSLIPGCQHGPDDE